eukprot:394332_1
MSVALVLLVLSNMASLSMSTLNISFTNSSDASCVYTDGNYVLDLTSIATKTYSWKSNNPSDPATYWYTPCRNGLRCSSTNTNIARDNDGIDRRCSYLGIDNGQKPYYNPEYQSW